MSGPKTLFAVVACLITAPILAQSPPEKDDAEIIVEAPRRLPSPAPHAPNRSAPEFIATIRYSVFYHDLDLATPTGAARLMKRIENTAHQACDYLDRRFPMDRDAECVSRAVKGATSAANAAIAAATRA
jgi:UrcA family protein